MTEKEEVLLLFIGELNHFSRRVLFLGEVKYKPGSKFDLDSISMGALNFIY
jgi:hypothetical protein